MNNLQPRYDLEHDYDVKECPLCRSSKFGFIQINENTPAVGWRQCECGMIYQEKWFHPETLEEFYASEYRDKVSAEGYPTPRDMYVHHLRAGRQGLALLNHGVLPNSRNTKFKALDFACSRGMNLKTLEEIYSGSELYGVELNESDIEYMEGIGINAFKTLDEIKDRDFDLVFLSHALEHFLDFRQLLNSLWMKLKSDGHIFIEVPAHTGPSAWSEFHAVIFKKETMIEALMKCGFVVKGCYYQSNLLTTIGMKP
jgi:2-polyprenyl-3-methyl-5-hydroxy-6-metoxy-1,4-benzoquinol methylase